MKNYSLLFGLFVVASFLSNEAGDAFGSQDADTIILAREFISNEKYAEAITSIDQHIKIYPDDAEGYYLMGVSFIRSIKYAGAKKWFAKAWELDSSYGSLIGDRYIEAGKMALEKGSSGLADILFKRAIGYAPSLNKSIGQHYLSIGITYLDEHESSKADFLFAKAVLRDAELQKNIMMITEDYGRKLLAIAKGETKERQKKYVDEALKYLGQKEVAEILQ